MGAGPSGVSRVERAKAVRELYVLDGSAEEFGWQERALCAQTDPEAFFPEKGGSTRELKGKQGDLDVTVHLEQQDTATTKVEVYARKNLAEWDKDYARTVLERIVKGQ